MYETARRSLGVAAACHWEALHGDPASPEAEAWSYIEAERALALIGFFDGMSKVKVK